MSAIVNTFFTNTGAPATGLSATIRIWEVDAGSHTIVVTDDPMVEIGDGFYKYDFNVGAGFDATKEYVVRSDGSNALPAGERYSSGKLAVDSSNLSIAAQDSLVDAVWDEDTASHQTAGSTGEAITQIGSATITAGDIANIADAVWDEDTASHQTAGSTGEAVTQTGSATISAGDIADIADAVWDEDASTHQSFGSTGAAQTADCDLSASSQATLVDAVWDEDTTAHQTAGSTGEAVTQTGSATITAGDIADIADAVWDEDATTHVTANTTGMYLNEIKADQVQLRLDVTQALQLANLLVKFETNRTRIDKTGKTLTVYDDDGTTPLQVFNLRDGSGSPSVDEVCERVPV